MRLKSALLLCAIAFHFCFGFDDLEPSVNPPAGLDSMAVPQLIAFGFDDNRYEDGVRWVVDTLLAGKLNPAGLGNKATFDGTPIKASFFVISNADQREAWRDAYNKGCEIGNHTVTHEKAMYDETYESHIEELGGCSKYIVNQLGLPPAHIQGFRTPFLAYADGGDMPNRTFQSIKDLGMFYDASVENGTHSSAIVWTKPNYPWTMNYTIGAIASLASYPTPGLWQVPHVNFLEPNTGAPKEKGFDSGLWPKGKSGPDFYNYLKNTLDWHYGLIDTIHSWDQQSGLVTILGNRAPMDIGLHSDYYSVVADTSNPDVMAFSSTVQERRQALVDFIDYALTLPDVRFVNMGDIVRWMQNPAAVADLSHNSLYEYTESIASPNLLKTAGISFNEADGSSATIKSDDENGRIEFNATVSDPNKKYTARRAVDVIVEFGENIDGFDGFSLTYNSEFPLRITFVQDGLSASEDSYYFAVPTSANDTTVTIPLSNRFVRQPHYHEESVALDLTKIREIAISPMVIDTVKTGAFTLDNLVLFGSDKFGQGVGIAEASAVPKEYLFRSSLSADKVSFSIPSAGEYQFVLYSVSGKELFRHIFEADGFGTVNVGLSGGSLSAGVYIATLQGAAGKFKQKIHFQ